MICVRETHGFTSDNDTLYYAAEFGRTTPIGDGPDSVIRAVPKDGSAPHDLGVLGGRTVKAVAQDASDVYVFSQPSGAAAQFCRVSKQGGPVGCFASAPATLGTRSFDRLGNLSVAGGILTLPVVEASTRNGAIAPPGFVRAPVIRILQISVP